MARILFLTNAPTPYQLDLFDELARHHEVRFVHHGRALANLAWQLPMREWLVDLPRGRVDAAMSLTRVMRSFRPAAVLIGGHSLPLATLCRRLARAVDADVSYWLEKPQPAPRWKAALRAVVLHRRLRAVDRVFCIGTQAADAYRSHARAVEILPYAIDPARYVPRTLGARHPVRFVFAGQLIDRKGVRELLDAFALLPPNLATLTIAGSGPLEPEVARAAASSDAIRPVGFVAPAALPELLAAHDVFVLPSRHDGWAVVVAEAMACGLPVIGTRETGATNDLVVPGATGAHVRIDATSIAAAMREYAEHPERVEVQGLAARQAFLTSRACVARARGVLEAAWATRGRT